MAALDLQPHLVGILSSCKAGVVGVHIICERPLSSLSGDKRPPGGLHPPASTSAYSYEYMYVGRYHGTHYEYSQILLLCSPTSRLAIAATVHQVILCRNQQRHPEGQLHARGFPGRIASRSRPVIAFCPCMLQGTSFPGTLASSASSSLALRARGHV